MAGIQVIFGNDLVGHCVRADMPCSPVVAAMPSNGDSC